MTADLDVDLAYHGDRELQPGLLDCAVNVRAGAPPDWLRAALDRALDDVARYPDATAATAAVAARHDRPVGEALVTAGGAEAFTLLARALRPRRAVVVHPQFTEPEAALRAAGHMVERVVLDERSGFRLDPEAVPDAADLVVVGNPTNPTGVLHPATAVAALARPGRVVVVDEAFIDFVPGERESIAGRRDLPGVVAVRSLTKMWGLAGLRVGYVVGDAAVVDAMRSAQPPWAVSGPALVAVVATATPQALAEAAAAARAIGPLRDELAAAARVLPGVRVVEPAAANFLLVRSAGLREWLRERGGIAVRRGDTFPGLGPEWARITVRDAATVARVAAALAEHATA